MSRKMAGQIETELVQRGRSWLKRGTTIRSAKRIFVGRTGRGITAA